MKFLIVLGITSMLLISGCSKSQSTNSNHFSINISNASNTQAATIEQAISGIDSIETDNYANKKLEFYYYIPASVLSEKEVAHPVLICVPGLSGRGESAVTSDFKQFADREGFVIIAPSFVYDAADWASRTSYQFPEIWSGNALLHIIDKVKGKNSLTISKFYLHGFSAGAQFVLRFALWKPELCAACAAHAPGGTVIPDNYCGVKFMISVGKEDTDRIAKAEAFYNNAKALGIDVDYREYEGGHMLPGSEIRDSIVFFKRVLSGN